MHDRPSIRKKNPNRWYLRKQNGGTHLFGLLLRIDGRSCIEIPEHAITSNNRCHHTKYLVIAREGRVGHEDVVPRHRPARDVRVEVAPGARARRRSSGGGAAEERRRRKTTREVRGGGRVRSNHGRGRSYESPASLSLVRGEKVVKRDAGLQPRAKQADRADE